VWQVLCNDSYMEITPQRKRERERQADEPSKHICVSAGGANCAAFQLASSVAGARDPATPLRSDTYISVFSLSLSLSLCLSPNECLPVHI
jgi:hypothetical protein